MHIDDKYLVYDINVDSIVEFEMQFKVYEPNVDTPTDE